MNLFSAHKQSGPCVLVIGNEKGGAGKTTVAMHMLVGLLVCGVRVLVLDADIRQRSLSRFLENRALRNQQAVVGVGALVMPDYMPLSHSTASGEGAARAQEEAWFQAAMSHARAEGMDVVLIDTPGSDSFYGRLAHSYADIIVTPVNDSFVDLDVLAAIDPTSYAVLHPSIYSEMVWEQKMQRAKRDQGSIDWLIIRNRLSHLHARNKERVVAVIGQMQKRIGCRYSDGLSERVVFRELFLQGRTLLDLKHPVPDGPLTLSLVAARQEVRRLLLALRMPALQQALQEDALFQPVGDAATHA